MVGQDRERFGYLAERRPAYQYAAFTNGLASCGVTA